MSKERARLRAEREREADLRQAAREAAEARVRRTTQRRERLTAPLTRLVPASTSRQTGALAERRRRQTSLVIALVVGAIVLVYAFSESWGLTAMVAIAGALGAPVLHTLMFRR